MAHPKLKPLFAPPCIVCLLLPLKSLVPSFHPSYCFIKPMNSRFTTPSQDNTIENSGKTRQPITNCHVETVNMDPSWCTSRRLWISSTASGSLGHWKRWDSHCIGKASPTAPDVHPFCVHYFLFWDQPSSKFYLQFLQRSTKTSEKNSRMFWKTSSKLEVGQLVFPNEKYPKRHPQIHWKSL